MTEVSRRGFLKLSGTAAGAAAVSGSGAASLTSVVKTTNKIKPVKKLSTYAKAYRGFLGEGGVKGGISQITQSFPSHDKTELLKYRTHVTKTIARSAFAEISRSLYKPDPSDSYMERKKGVPSPNLNRLSEAYLQSEIEPIKSRMRKKGMSEAALKKEWIRHDMKNTEDVLRESIRNRGELELKGAEAKKAEKTPGTRLYKEKQRFDKIYQENNPTEPKKTEPKKTTKRQLFGKAFRKLKGAIRGGFGGPRSGKTGIGSGPPGFQDPSRVSGYHY